MQPTYNTYIASLSAVSEVLHLGLGAIGNTQQSDHCYIILQFRTKFASHKRLRLIFYHTEHGKPLNLKVVPTKTWEVFINLKLLLWLYH